MIYLNKGVKKIDALRREGTRGTGDYTSMDNALEMKKMVVRIKKRW